MTKGKRKRTSYIKTLTSAACPQKRKGGEKKLEGIPSGNFPYRSNWVWKGEKEREPPTSGEPLPPPPSAPNI